MLVVKNMTMMNDRLVQDLSQILLFLLNGKTNINAIIKKTRIYKNRVFDANNFLEKAKLAHKIKDKLIHKQKIDLQLSEFGQELASFIENTEKFEKSFEQLKNTIKRVYHLPEGVDKKAVRSLLLSRGLNHQEIDKHNDHLGFAEAFERDSISLLIDEIGNKYAMFLLKFNPNSYAREYLKEVITRQLSRYLLLKVETLVEDNYFRCEKCGIDLSKQVTTKHRTNEIIEENGLRLFDFLDDYMYILFNNRHFSNDVRGILSSLFSVVHLPKEYVEQKVKKIIEEIESLPRPRVSPYLDEIEVMRNIDTYKKIYNYVAELNASA